MKILNPHVAFLDEATTSKESHFANCARICYASNGSNDNALYESLWKKNHRSMYRHVSRYFIIPINAIHSAIIHSFVECPYIDYVEDNNNFYVSTNEQFFRENLKLQQLKEYEIDTITAHNNLTFYKYKLLRFTFVIDTGIDITRELNRTSPNTIAEQSTRCVDFNKKIGIVFKKCHWMNSLNLYRSLLTKFMCKVDEWFYKISRSKYGLNLKPQDARWCLFLDTMSRVAYTYSIKEWEHILALRFAGITGEPHPDAKIVARCIYGYLNENEGYEFDFV